MLSFTRVVHGGPGRSSGSATVDQGHVWYPVTLENGDTEWNGDIYAAGSITPEVSDQFGTAFPQQSQAIINSFLEYPLVDSTWFAKNCDFFLYLRSKSSGRGVSPGNSLCNVQSDTERAEPG